MTHVHVVLMGAGGHARETMDVLESLWGRARAQEQVHAYAEPSCVTPDARSLMESRGYSVREDLAGATHYIPAVGDGFLRARFAQEADDAGLQPYGAISPLSQVINEEGISDGFICFPGSYVSTNVRIGRHTHLNQACRVSHDVVLGDYCTLGPGALITGGCHVGDLAVVGAGSVLLPHVSVGAQAVVGAGAVVTRDVAPGATVVGNPARPRA